MSELLSVSALPNWHPALVHFPIALLPAALAFDLGAVLARRAWLDRAAALLYAAAAAGAVAAYRAGRAAEDSLGLVPPTVQPELAAHADAAWRALWALVALALLRAVLWWLDRASPTATRRPLRAAGLLVGAGALALLIVAASRGGALVYRHGVAVTLPAPAPAELPAAAPASEADPSAGLVRAADGSLAWQPRPVDAPAFSRILSPAPGSPPQALEALPDAGPGLALRVREPALVLLPEPCGDVQLEVELDLTGLDGAVALAHHAEDPANASLFRVTTAGRAALVERRAASERRLDERPVELPRGPVRLTVSAAGRHLKGLVGEQTVVHGHTAPAAAQGCGLWLSGSGVVRLLALRATPLAAP
jgi:uncharacterized membrane protein